MSYMKRRAQIEDEYAKSMLKLSGVMLEHPFPKEGTFSDGWKALHETTQLVGDNKSKLSVAINAMHDELNTVCKDAERSRKQLKEAGLKQLKQLSDFEQMAIKSKSRYEQLHGELQQFRINMRDPKFEETYLKKLNLFGRKKNQDEMEHKLAQYGHEQRQYELEYSRMNLEYHSHGLPDLIQQMKDVNDECDAALQALMLKYAVVYEDALFADGKSVCPVETSAPSLRQSLSHINIDKDFRLDIAKHMATASKVDFHSGSIDVPAKSNDEDVFGMELDAVLEREQSECPIVLQKCYSTIESGSGDRVKSYQGDSAPGNVVKRFFVELPEPLLTISLFADFTKAASISSTKRRLVAVHELVNEIPDSNYIVLKNLTRHLCAVAEEDASKITILSGIFGPILMAGRDDGAIDNSVCVVVETILKGYRAIFE